MKRALLVVDTQPTFAPGPHWAAPGDEPDFATSWPRHGAAGEGEADLHPALLAAVGAAPGTVPSVFSGLVRKGMEAAAYSAFDGLVVDDPEVLRPTGVALADWLRARQVTDVDVCGIATDHCDLATALDAVAAGFRTRLLVDLTVGVGPATTEAALQRMAEAGVEILDSADA